MPICHRVSCVLGDGNANALPVTAGQQRITDIDLKSKGLTVRFRQVYVAFTWMKRLIT
jgi:hypothetical protein